MPQTNPHRLTREQMHQVIDEGGSVLFPNGRIVERKHELPSEADIALMTGDASRGDAAAAELDRQIAELIRQRGTLADRRALAEARERPEIEQPDADLRADEQARRRADLLATAPDRPTEAAADIAKPAPAPARAGTGGPESPPAPPEDKGRSRPK